MKSLPDKSNGLQLTLRHECHVMKRGYDCENFVLVYSERKRRNRLPMFPANLSYSRNMNVAIWIESSSIETLVYKCNTGCCGRRNNIILDTVAWLRLLTNNQSIDCSSRRPARCTARRMATVAPCSVSLSITDFFLVIWRDTVFGEY